MKVLFVTPYLGVSYGGTSRVVIELAKSLGKLELDVDVVSTNANDGEEINIQLHIWLDQDDYRLKYFSAWHRSDLVLSFTLIRWLAHNIKSYDVVHTHTLFSPIIAFTHFLCRLYKIPYVMTPHGMLDPWALAYKAWKKRYYYQYLEQPSLRYASAIHALSASEIDQVRTLGFSQTILVPNGVNKHEFENLPHAQFFYDKFPDLQSKKLILFLGRLDPKKGLDLLAPAFSDVHQAFPDTHLVVAGPDSIDFIATARSYFSYANCLDAVTFTGMLAGVMKYAALTAADVYVSPSYSEGFSMSILEGMASALPCVFTSGCNFPEAAKANVAYEVAIDVDEIATALIKCLQHPEQSRLMGQKAQQFIFNYYDWESIAVRLHRTYESILDGSTKLKHHNSIPIT